MTSVEQIFDTYRHMRATGKQTNDIVRDLRTQIDPLMATEKDTLGRLIRAYEKRFETPSTLPTAPERATSGVKPLRRATNTPTLKPLDTSALKAGATNAEAITDEKQTMRVKRLKPLADASTDMIACPNCEKLNHKKAGACYACGALLGDLQQATATRQFEDADNRYFASHYFSSNSVLILQPRDSVQEHEVFPQDAGHEVVIGRKADQIAVAPDVDLAVNGAEQLGVSRMHLSLKYNRHDNTLTVSDLGSANGTYINGQKLHPKEERILRSEDSVRLGRLVLTVRFLHPNAQLM